MIAELYSSAKYGSHESSIDSPYSRFGPSHMRFREAENTILEKVKSPELFTEDEKQKCGGRNPFPPAHRGMKKNFRERKTGNHHRTSSENSSAESGSWSRICGLRDHQ